MALGVETLGAALGVALGADIAGPRQVRQHLRKAHRRVAVPAGLATFARSLSLAWTMTPARLRRFGFAAFGFERRLLPQLQSHVSIPRDVLHQMATSIGISRNQRLMQTAGSDLALGKLGKQATAKTSPRSTKPAGTDLQPHSRHTPAVNLKTLDQAARRRNSSNTALDYRRRDASAAAGPPAGRHYLAAGSQGRTSLDLAPVPRTATNRLVASRHRPQATLFRASGTTLVDRRRTM